MLDEFYGDQMRAFGISPFCVPNFMITEAENYCKIDLGIFKTHTSMTALVMNIGGHFEVTNAGDGVVKHGFFFGNGEIPHMNDPTDPEFGMGAHERERIAMKIYKTEDSQGLYDIRKKDQDQTKFKNREI